MDRFAEVEEEDEEGAEEQADDGNVLPVVEVARVL